jgi:hypothetical protein
MTLMAPDRELLELQEPLRLGKVIFRLDKYIDPMDSFRENSMVNL